MAGHPNALCIKVKELEMVDKIEKLSMAGPSQSPTSELEIEYRAGFHA
jgi:hypothetical protein